LKFRLSEVGIFGFLVFESSGEALKDRSEDEVLHGDGVRQFLEQGSALDVRDKRIADARGG
jgi:hypothetical protein